MSGGRAEEKIIGDAYGSGHEACHGGTTKQDSDCEDALDRIFRIAHAGPYGARDVVVVEGDEETYSLMVNLLLTRRWNFLSFGGKGGEQSLEQKRS